MKIAISGTELGAEETISPLLRAARALRVSYVELWFPRNTARQGVEGVVRSLEEAEVQVACVASGSELYREGGSSDDQKLLLEAIRLAGEVGAPFANTYFGYAASRNDEEAIKIYAGLLGPCLEEAVNRGVTIVLENEFNAFAVDDARSDITRRPESLRRLFELVDSNRFRLNFDPANFLCAGVSPVVEAYETLSDWIGYVHIKDIAERGRDPAPRGCGLRWRSFRDFDREFIATPLGYGAVPWEDLLLLLHQDGYEGFLTLEPHAETGDRTDAWQQSADFLRAQLRGLDPSHPLKDP